MFRKQLNARENGMNLLGIKWERWDWLGIVNIYHLQYKQDFIEQLKVKYVTLKDMNNEARSLGSQRASSRCVLLLVPRYLV